MGICTKQWGGGEFKGLRAALYALLGVLIFVCVVRTGRAIAQDGPVGRLETVFGNVAVERGGTKLPGAVDTEIWPADVLHVEKNSTAMLKFTDGSSVVATAESSMVVSKYVAMAQGKRVNANMLLDVIKGKLRFFFKKTDTTVRTPNATIGVRGTTFFVDTTSNVTTVVMVEGRVAVSNMTNPSVVVELGSAQLTRIMERANPEAPEKAPPTLLMEMNKSVKNVDLGKAGGAVEPPQNSPAPTGTQAPAKQGSKAAPKPVEDGKLVVDPSGESTLDAPAGQTPAGAALPQGGKAPVTAPSGSSDGASGDGSGADGGGLDGATAPKLAEPAASVEKTVQQINTSATRPIDAKSGSQNRKTKIGVNVR